MKTAVAELLDRCIEDVRRGRASIDECLAAHPEHAAELAPLLRLATRIDPAAVPEPDAAARLRMAARVRQGVLGSTPRRSWWRALAADSHYRVAMAAAAAIVLLLFAGFAGLVIESRDAAPGDALYALKRNVERVETAVRPESAVDEHARQSQRRLAELRTLTRRNDANRLPKALAAYEREFNRLLVAASAASHKDASRALRIATAQAAELVRLKDNHPEAAPVLDPAIVRAADQLPGIANALAFGVAEDAQQAEMQRGVQQSAAASQAAPADSAGAESVRQRAEQVRRIFADLHTAINEAEAHGALTRVQAQELRVLILNETLLGQGGDNAVVAAIVGRLGQALAACAATGCASQEVVDAVHARIASSALALGIAPPGAPVVKAAATPTAARGGAAPAAPATTTPLPAGTSRAGGAPAPATTPTPAPAQPSPTQAPTTAAAPPAAAATAAPAPTQPSMPALTAGTPPGANTAPPSSPAATAAAPTRTPTAGVAAVMPPAGSPAAASGFAATPVPTPAARTTTPTQIPARTVTPTLALTTIPTPSPTPTSTATATPTPTPTPTATPTATPAP